MAKRSWTPTVHQKGHTSLDTLRTSTARHLECGCLPARTKYFRSCQVVLSLHTSDFSAIAKSPAAEKALRTLNNIRPGCGTVGERRWNSDCIAVMKEMVRIPNPAALAKEVACVWSDNIEVNLAQEVDLLKAKRGKGRAFGETEIQTELARLVAKTRAKKVSTTSGCHMARTIPPWQQSYSGPSCPTGCSSSSLIMPSEDMA